MVGERGALGVPGGPGCVLDVDRVVRREQHLPGGERGGERTRVASAVGQGQPVGAAEQDDPAQVGAARPSVLDHRGVVGCPEGGSGHQQADARLVDHVREFVGAVRRVDRHQDRADLRGGVLQDRPLRAVRRPDADPIALVDAQPDQPVRERQHVMVQPRIGPPPSGEPVDQGLAVGMSHRHPVEILADRLAEQWLVTSAVGVRRHDGGRSCHWWLLRSAGDHEGHDPARAYVHARSRDDGVCHLTRKTSRRSRRTVTRKPASAGVRIPSRTMRSACAGTARRTGTSEDPVKPACVPRRALGSAAPFPVAAAPRSRRAAA